MSKVFIIIREDEDGKSIVSVTNEAGKAYDIANEKTDPDFCSITIEEHEVK